MEKVGDEAATKFINALIKSVQTLCHGYLEFSSGIEIIGHINLMVDKGTSLDYILKEKVCKNAENSTLFISNSFHAEPKCEQEILGKNLQQPGNQVVQNKQSTETGETGRLSSAISSISSALSGSRERSRRSSGTKDSDSSHSQQSTTKRKASDDHSSEFRPSKVSSHHDNVSHSSSESPFPPTSSSPVDSKAALQQLGTSEADMSETMLPQTANVTSDSSADIGVNLAGSVLEPVDDQSNPDLADRDDDSDGDLEVTFIKEEYVEGERSACEYENSSGQQFVGGPHQRGSESMPDPSLFPVALHTSSSASATYVPSAHDLGAGGQHFPPGSLGPSTSQPQPGPSSMRGMSGAQSYGNSLSAFGPMGPSGLPLDQIRGGPGTSRQNRVIPRASSSNLSFYRQRSNYSSSHLSLQRAFALYRDDKRKRRAGRREEEVKTKERLELMSAGYRQLLEQKGLSSAEGYKKAMEREKRRVAKKLYRETLSEGKKAEIKEKDKERKRMKRASRSANAESVSNIIQQFSLGFSDSVPGLGSGSIQNTIRAGSDSRTGSDSAGSSLGTCTGSAGGGLGIGTGSVGNISGVGSGSVGLSEMGHQTAGTIPRLGSGSVRGVSGLATPSVESVSWIDSVSFDTGVEERAVSSASIPSDGQDPMKLD